MKEPEFQIIQILSGENELLFPCYKTHPGLF